MKIKWKELKPKIDEMYQSGMTVEEMAEKLKMNPITIVDKLYEWGYKNLHMKRKYVNEFWCRQCGEHVVADPMFGDMRTVFCSRQCEKKYWKKPRKHGNGFHLVEGLKK